MRGKSFRRRKFEDGVFTDRVLEFGRGFGEEGLVGGGGGGEVQLRFLHLVDDLLGAGQQLREVGVCYRHPLLYIYINNNVKIWVGGAIGVGFITRRLLRDRRKV